MRTLVIVSAVLGAIGCGAIAATEAEAGDSFDLKYDRKQKTGFVATLTRTHRNYQEIMGNPVESNSIDVIEYRFRVLSKTSDAMDLELTYGPREHRVADSQSNSPVDFSSLLGKKVSLDMTSTGDVSNFEGFEKLPTIALPDQGMSLTPSRYIREVEDLFPEMAGRPLEVGEEWKYTEEYEEPLENGSLTITVAHRYRIAGKERIRGLECVRLEGLLDVSGVGRIDMGGAALDISMSGAAEEAVYFAYKEGMIVTLEWTSAVSGKAVNESMGVSMPFKHDIGVKVDVSF